MGGSLRLCEPGTEASDPVAQFFGQIVECDIDEKDISAKRLKKKSNFRFSRMKRNSFSTPMLQSESLSEGNAQHSSSSFSSSTLRFTSQSRSMVLLLSAERVPANRDASV